MSQSDCVGDGCATILRLWKVNESEITARQPSVPKCIGISILLIDKYVPGFYHFWFKAVAYFMLESGYA
jgi:hypothetical protein